MTVSLVKDGVEQIRLFGFNDNWSSARVTVLPLLFGELIKKTHGIQTDYFSDLYHDARWLDSIVHGPMEFYFVVRNYGTHIGSSYDDVKYAAGMSAGSKFYKVNLYVERGTWFVKFTDLPA